MIVTIYVNTEEKQALAQRDFDNFISDKVAQVLNDADEKEEYLYAFLEERGYDIIDCFEMSESRKTDLLEDFRSWVFDDLKQYYLDDVFDVYTIDV